MNLYLDTSALVKLYVEEEGSPHVRSLAKKANVVATSAIAYVEARSAFVRRRHERGLSVGDYRRIVRSLESDWARYLTIEITEVLIRQAADLAESHRLRAYDAIHLASAVVLRAHLDEPIAFASWDQGLDKAARHEGLQAVSIGSPH